LDHPEAAIENTIKKSGYQNKDHVFLQKEQTKKDKLTQKRKNDQIAQRDPLGNPVPQIQVDAESKTGDGNKKTDLGKRKADLIKIHRNVKGKHPDKK